MAFSHGKDAIFKIDSAGGVLTDISTYLTSASLSRAIDTAETSTLGTSDKTYVAGMRGATFSCEGNFDPTFDTLINGIIEGDAAVDFEYYPAGEPVGATKPKYSGQVIVTSYEPSASVSDMAGGSVEFQVTGAITRAVA